MRDDGPDDEDAKHAVPTSEIIATLFENHSAFLAFVERRVESHDVAEEILQNALAKNVEKLDTVRDTAIGWFYKVLRNAIIDYRRSKTAADKRFKEYSAHAEANDTREDELHRVVCRCVGELAGGLKPEYAEALQRVDVDGVAVKDYAVHAGISTSNAGVRLFRAREALRKQVTLECGACAKQGCLDCTCGH